MTAKEVKEQLQFEAKIIRDYRDRIERLRGGSSRNAETVSVQGGKRGDPVSRTVCEIVRLEGLMRGHIDRVWDHLAYCDTQPQRDVLKFRYMHWMRWEKIALEMKYSEQHVYRLHWQAMRVISEKLSTLPESLHES